MKKLFAAALVLLALSARSQTPWPFAGEIAQFKRQDSLHFPAANQIVFTGSSSFTKWKDVQDYFPGVPIINRGFGGSSLPDLIHYLPDVVYRYNPKQVVIYCGDNDFMAEGVTAETVVARAKDLLTQIRQHLPLANIVYVSIKPSPSRFRLLDEATRANRAIEAYVRTQENMRFVDVFHPMMRDGRPMPEIFGPDSLHMNADGYRIWQKALKPALKP